LLRGESTECTEQRLRLSLLLSGFLSVLAIAPFPHTSRYRIISRKKYPAMKKRFGSRPCVRAHHIRATSSPKLMLRRNQTSRQRDPGSVPSTNSVTLFYIERGSCTVQFQFQFRLIKLHWDSITFNDSIDLLLSLYYRRVNIIYGKKKLQYNDSIGYSYIVFTKFFSFVPYNVCACNIQW